MLDKLKEMEEDAKKFDDFNVATVQEFWDSTSDVYEKVYQTVEYPDPKM